MSGVETGPTPSADRATWIRELLRLDEEQEDAVADVDDARWGELEDTHRAFVERFLSMLPPRAGVLDAACGTGTYFPLVLASGRSVLGVDHSGASLATAVAKFSDVPTAKHDLGFAIEEEEEGPWHEDGYAYHHMLARGVEDWGRARDGR